MLLFLVLVSNTLNRLLASLWICVVVVMVSFPFCCWIILVVVIVVVVIMIAGCGWWWWLVGLGFGLERSCFVRKKKR